MRKGVFSVIIELILTEAKLDSPYINFFAENYQDFIAFILKKYPMKGMTPYCGEMFRAFTRVPVMINLPHLGSLEENAVF